MDVVTFEVSFICGLDVVNGESLCSQACVFRTRCNVYNAMVLVPVDSKEGIGVAIFWSTLQCA